MVLAGVPCAAALGGHSQSTGDESDNEASFWFEAFVGSFQPARDSSLATCFSVDGTLERGLLCRCVADALLEQHARFQMQRSQRLQYLRELIEQCSDPTRTMRLCRAYTEAEAARSDLDKAGCMWDLALLATYLPRRVFQRFQMPLVPCNAQLLQDIKSSLHNAMQTLQSFGVPGPNDHFTGLSQISTKQVVEQDCRLLIDAVLCPILRFVGFTMRTEILFKSKQLSSNRVDYCIFDRQNECIAVLEAKRNTFHRGFVQGILQLLLLQGCASNPRRPLIGIVSDGLRWVFMVMTPRHIWVDGPRVHTAHTWATMRLLVRLSRCSRQSFRRRSLKGFVLQKLHHLRPNALSTSSQLIQMVSRFSPAQLQLNGPLIKFKWRP
eukprot:m.158350 g.158350  ORF g.158350 m.158350 type:complete len:380 (+) comp10246_c0_seq3:576-1715(+)